MLAYSRFLRQIGITAQVRLIDWRNISGATPRSIST